MHAFAFDRECGLGRRSRGGSVAHASSPTTETISGPDRCLRGRHGSAPALAAVTATRTDGNLVITGDLELPNDITIGEGIGGQNPDRAEFRNQAETAG
jgi:hypothetical protein